MAESAVFNQRAEGATISLSANRLKLYKGINLRVLRAAIYLKNESRYHAHQCPFRKQSKDFVYKPLSALQKAYASSEDNENTRI
jgi:hypothetical protein